MGPRGRWVCVRVWGEVRSGIWEVRKTQREVTMHNGVLGALRSMPCRELVTPFSPRPSPSTQGGAASRRIGTSYDTLDTPGCPAVSQGDDEQHTQDPEAFAVLTSQTHAFHMM